MVVDDDFVEPPPGRKSEDLPTGWMGTDDGSNRVVQIHREAARRSAVAGLTASTMPPPLEATATLAGVGTLSADAQVVKAVGDGRRRFEHQLSEHPAEIRDAASVLAQAVKDQIAELRAERRNDTAELVDFLEKVARELDRLVGALDRAIEERAKGSADEPIFLGEAKKIGDQLKAAFDESLPSIARFSIRIGVVAAAAIFLQHVCGLDPNIAAVTSILKATFPQKNSN